MRLAATRLVALVLAGCAVAVRQTTPARPVFEFVADFDAAFGVNGLPHGWRAAETNARGTPASWGRVPDGDGGAFLAVLRNPNLGQTASLAMLSGLRFSNLDAVVRVHAGGGIAFRMRDVRHYDLVRWLPRAGRLELCTVEDGRLTVLAAASAGAASGDWHELGVVARGARVTVRFDGADRLHHAGLPGGEAGLVGFWAAAGSTPSFDALRVR